MHILGLGRAVAWRKRVYMHACMHVYCWRGNKPPYVEFFNYSATTMGSTALAVCPPPFKVISSWYRAAQTVASSSSSERAKILRVDK